MYTRVLRSTKRLSRAWWLEFTTPALRRRARLVFGVVCFLVRVAALLLLMLSVPRLLPQGAAAGAAAARARAAAANRSNSSGGGRQVEKHWPMLLPGQLNGSIGTQSDPDGGFEAFLALLANTLRAQPLGRPSLDFALAELAPQLDSASLWLEFGVWTGHSLDLLGRRAHELGRQRKVFGFDAFRGLPESWHRSHGQGKLDFESLSAEELSNTGNAEIIAGWFNESLPVFLQGESAPVSLVHIVSAPYSSASTVLRLLGPRLRPGAVIVFDGLSNSSGFRSGEAQALYEWLQSPEFTRAGHTGVQVIGYHGPALLTVDAEIEAAKRVQGDTVQRCPQDAVFRVW